MKNNDLSFEPENSIFLHNWEAFVNFNYLVRTSETIHFFWFTTDMQYFVYAEYNRSDANVHQTIWGNTDVIYPQYKYQQYVKVPEIDFTIVRHICKSTHNVPLRTQAIQILIEENISPNVLIYLQIEKHH